MVQLVLCTMQGCTVVHSAFGYGNETVLCNDPHSQPFTDLDNCEAVEKARSASNTCVMMCRIGPWMFPVEVTTCFLPAGMYVHHSVTHASIANFKASFRETLAT